MDDKLRQLGRALVRVAACQTSSLVRKLNWVMEKCGGERRLLALLADDYQVRRRAALDHRHVVAPISMQQNRFLVCVRISRASSAFCVGEHRNATTPTAASASSMNSS